MNLQFSISDWAAWAPGLADQAAWLAHFADPDQKWSSSDAVAPVPELAPMTRRRLNRIGRSALQVAYAAQANTSPCPVIFASRYGDLERSVLLLRALANQEGLSPTAFSVSVHNAIGAILSIERGDTENYSALAAGVNTVPSALVEACGLLADGAPAVLLVVYEDPLPEVYAAFAKAPQLPYAWACRVVPPQPQQSVISLTKTTSQVEPGESPDALRTDLAVLRLLIGAARTLDTHCWRYERV